MKPPKKPPPMLETPQTQECVLHELQLLECELRDLLVDMDPAIPRVARSTIETRLRAVELVIVWLNRKLERAGLRAAKQ